MRPTFEISLFAQIGSDGMCSRLKMYIRRRMQQSTWVLYTLGSKMSSWKEWCIDLMSLIVIDIGIILMCLYFNPDDTRFCVAAMIVLSIFGVFILFLYVHVGPKHDYPAKPGDRPASIVVMYERCLSPTALWGYFIAGIWINTVCSKMKEYVIYDDVIVLLNMFDPPGVNEYEAHVYHFIPLCMLFSMGFWRIVHHKCFVPHTQPVQKALPAAKPPITEKMGSHYIVATQHVLEKVIDVTKNVDVYGHKFKEIYQTGCNNTQKKILNLSRVGALRNAEAIVVTGTGTEETKEANGKDPADSYFNLQSAAVALGTAETIAVPITTTTTKTTKKPIRKRRGDGMSGEQPRASRTRRI